MEIKKKEIMKILEDKFVFYEKILSLSKEQKVAVINGCSSARIAGIVNEKDIIINKIKKLERILETSLNTLKKYPETESLINGIKQLIKKTLRIETECVECIEQNKDKVYKEWRNLVKGKQIAKGYGGGTINKQGLISIRD